MTSKKIFRYCFDAFAGFIQHGLTLENPTSANSNWRNLESIFNTLAV